MESRKMQLVASGLVLFLSGTLLGGYVVWSQQKPNSALNRARGIRNATAAGTKSKQIFHLPDASAAGIPIDPESANPPWTFPAPVSMPIGTKSAPVFMPEDVAGSAPSDSRPPQPSPPPPPVEEESVDALYVPLQRSSTNIGAAP